MLDGTTLTIGGDGIPGHPVELVASPLGGTFSDISAALVIAPNPHRAFDPDHQRFVHAVAESISNALDGAYRRSVELGEFRHISDTLQAAMLPSASDLPTIAARYLPAAGALAVGGDWYDVIDLDDHRRALVVGDCVGHGLEAATVMAQLRSAARAMLLEGRRPAEVIEGLDTFAGALDGAMGTTVVCVVYDRVARRMTYARAGHPPPLVSDASGHRWLDANGGPPLAAVPGVARTEASEDVSDAGLIVMYSDGLIERRREHLDIGMARLADSVAQLEGLAVQAIADGLLRDLEPENTRDDVVLVIKRF